MTNELKMNELNDNDLEQVSGSGMIGTAVKVVAAFMAGTEVGALAKKLYDKATQ